MGENAKKELLHGTEMSDSLLYHVRGSADGIASHRVTEELVVSKEAPEVFQEQKANDLLASSFPAHSVNPVLVVR